MSQSHVFTPQEFLFGTETEKPEQEQAPNSLSSKPQTQSASQPLKNNSEAANRCAGDHKDLANLVRIVLYTDGGCRGNPGPGAWAAISYLEYANGQYIANGIEPNQDQRVCELAGSAEHTTNNQMELQAMIAGLQSVLHEYPECFDSKPDNQLAQLEVAVYTDSQYVKNGITSWIHTWRSNSWRTSAKKPVKNSDLWRQLDEQCRRVQSCAKLQWHWVKGHTGNYYNERCDQLVRQNFPH